MRLPLVVGRSLELAAYPDAVGSRLLHRRYDQVRRADVAAELAPAVFDVAHIRLTNSRSHLCSKVIEASLTKLPSTGDRQVVRRSNSSNCDSGYRPETRLECIERDRLLGVQDERPLRRIERRLARTVELVERQGTLFTVWVIGA